MKNISITFTFIFILMILISGCDSTEKKVKSSIMNDLKNLSKNMQEATEEHSKRLKNSKEDFSTIPTFNTSGKK